jgi:hypothetical protein
MLKSILITYLCFISIVLFAQTNQHINGYVHDYETGEVLIGASVYTFQGVGVVTNKYGYFSMKIPVNTDSIIVSYIGYQKQSIDINENNMLKIYLKSGVDIEEVSIVENSINRPEISINRLNMKQAKQLPMLFGEADIIKNLQLMPGVQSGGEGKSALYVRGGSPDQNLILLDNVPLYYVAHFGGFFSVFNADAINDVQLIKGGFPARYGSRLSSVLDITMREGNVNKFGMQGTIGLLSSKIAIEMPIIKQKSSILLSVRKNLFPIFRLMSTGLNYSFYDINAKWNYIFNDKNRVYASFYLGNDKVKTLQNDNKFTQSNQDVKWGNIMGSLRWNKIWNAALFSNLTLYSTNYKYQTHYSYTYTSDSVNRNYGNELLSAINDFGLKYEINQTVSQHLNIRYGLSSIYHTFHPNDEWVKQSGTNIPTLNEQYNSQLTAWENAAYCEAVLSINKLSSNIGLRYANFIQDKKDYHSLEPRLTLNYAFTDAFALKYGYSYMQQFVHLLTYSGTGLPSDYWMPTTTNIEPENSHQNAAGFSCLLFDNSFNFTTDVYYKSMNELITFKPGASLSGNLSNWENLVESSGTGQNYGIEFFLQKTTGKTTGWSGLTISKASREFDNINNGKSYRFKYDRLIDFSIVVVHELKPGITVSGTWTYGSGYPVTLASEMYNIDNTDVLVYDEKNSYEMNPYHRLDLGINFIKKTSWGERTWNISLINAYNRQNPYFYYYERSSEMVQVESEGGISMESKQGGLQLKQFSLFSILPTFSYSFKF